MLSLYSDYDPCMPFLTLDCFLSKSFFNSEMCLCMKMAKKSMMFLLKAFKLQLTFMFVWFNSIDLPTWGLITLQCSWSNGVKVCKSQAGFVNFRSSWRRSSCAWWTHMFIHYDLLLVELLRKKNKYSFTFLAPKLSFSFFFMRKRQFPS